MSMVYCNDCEVIFDSDYVVCHEIPENDTALICEDCHAEREMSLEDAKEFVK